MSHPLTVFHFHEQVLECTLLALHLALQCIVEPHTIPSSTKLLHCKIPRGSLCDGLRAVCNQYIPRVGFHAVCNYYMVDSVSGESQEGGGGGKCPDGTVHPSSWWRSSSSCALLHSAAGPGMHPMNNALQCVQELCKYCVPTAHSSWFLPVLIFIVLPLIHIMGNVFQ